MILQKKVVEEETVYWFLLLLGRQEGAMSCRFLIKYCADFFYQFSVVCPPGFGSCYCCCWYSYETTVPNEIDDESATVPAMELPLPLPLAPVMVMVVVVVAVWVADCKNKCYHWNLLPPRGPPSYCSDCHH